jgi:hypothetical protein
MQKKHTLVGDFVGFIRHEKKWWLIPLTVALVLVGLLSIFATASPLSPFIYSLF